MITVVEGIVSKRKGSPYRSGRSPDWVKMKNAEAASGKARGGRGLEPTSEGHVCATPVPKVQKKSRRVVRRPNLEICDNRRGHAMVHNPTVGNVQATEFSKLSTQSAPFVYFGVVTAGVHHGTIQLELAASTLVPTPDGKVASVHVITAHLRCNASAAADLRKAMSSFYLRQQRADRAIFMLGYVSAGNKREAAAVAPFDLDERSRMAEDEEPGHAGGEARGGRGLGPGAIKRFGRDASGIAPRPTAQHPAAYPIWRVAQCLK